MTPMTFEEWCASDGSGVDHAARYRRYRAYVAGVNFIRSQIGVVPQAVDRLVQTSIERAHTGA